MYHIPVLLEEVIALLKLQPGHNVIDCTLGGGGHARAMFQAITPEGKLLGIDQDENALRAAEAGIKKQESKDRFYLVHDNFRNLERIVSEHNFHPVHAVLLDLGMSSYQLDESDRGFSFQKNTPLNMRFNGGGVSANAGINAYHIINEYPKQKLAEIFKTYGEVRSPGVIAHRIENARKARPIKTTDELVFALTGPAAKRTQDPRAMSPKAVKLFAKAFQAIRIEVNDELVALSETLPQITRVLAKKGRVAVISYHSLEDRIVKRYFKEASRGCVCPKELPVCRCDHKPELSIVTKHAITPGAGEIAGNPRSRSAKLRVAERIN